VREASRRLARARRPVLLIGSQATAPASRVDAVAAAADALGTPVFLSGMARGLMGRDHARLFRHCRRQALRDADLVILIGVPCDFRLGYGHHISRRAAVIAANSSAAELVLNRKPSLAVQADAGAFLMDLACAHAGCSREASWHDWMDSLRRHEHERQATIDRQVRADATPLDPLYLCQRLEATMGDDSIMIGDGGDFVATASYLLRPRRPLSWLDPGPFGTLGAGAGFAIGAALSRPQSEVWLLYGDGAAAYSLAEFDTCVRHGIPLVAVVGNDAAWSQIARDQLAVLGDDVATKLRRTDYHTVAMGYGGGGLLLDAPGDIDRVLAQAGRMAAQGGPVLINAQLGANAFRSGSMSL
jgi:acetolactate synthase-1/2/3 large subunit